MEAGTINEDEMILLNVTGGGQKRLFAEHEINYLQPQVTVSKDEISEDTVNKLFT